MVFLHEKEINTPIDKYGMNLIIYANSVERKLRSKSFL